MKNILILLLILTGLLNGQDNKWREGISKSRPYIVVKRRIKRDNLNLVVRQIHLPESQLAEMFAFGGRDIIADEDKLYVLFPNGLHKYIIKDNKLTLDESFAEKGTLKLKKADRISLVSNANLVVSNGRYTCLYNQKGELLSKIEVRDAKFKYGTNEGAGIEDRKLAILNIKDNKFTKKIIELEGEKFDLGFKEVHFIDNNIALAFQDDSHKIRTYDMNGKLLSVTYKDKEKKKTFCQVNDIKKLNELLFILDGNCQTFNICTKAGDLVAELKDTDFALNRPWFMAICFDNNGNAYMMVKQKRSPIDGKSKINVSETVILKIEGLNKISKK